MPDQYQLRPVQDDEFETWANAVVNSYGEDWPAGQLEVERTMIDLGQSLGAFDGNDPVGGTAYYSRTMTIPGGVQIPIAGVGWVGVAPTHRRQGILTAMTRKQFDDLHQSGEYSVAVLRASEAAIYGRYGYGIASYEAAMLADKRAMQLQPAIDLGKGRVKLLSQDEARPTMERLYEETYRMRTGWVEREPKYWNYRIHDVERPSSDLTAPRFAVHEEPNGSTTGYAIYRFQGNQTGHGPESGSVQVLELVTASPQAYATLWRFLINLDLFPHISYHGAIDEPLPHLLIDSRAVQATTTTDVLQVRLIDVEQALAARRYAIPLDVVLDVEDAFCPWNAGRYRLQANGDEVRCERTTASADLRLTSTELGAAYLGGTSLAILAAAGRVVELSPGTLARCAIAFRSEREPWYPGCWSFPSI